MYRVLCLVVFQVVAVASHPIELAVIDGRVYPILNEPPVTEDPPGEDLHADRLVSDTRPQREARLWQIPDEFKILDPARRRRIDRFDIDQVRIESSHTEFEMSTSPDETAVDMAQNPSQGLKEFPVDKMAPISRPPISPTAPPEPPVEVPATGLGESAIGGRVKVPMDAVPESPLESVPTNQVTRPPLVPNTPYRPYSYSNIDEPSSSGSSQEMDSPSAIGQKTPRSCTRCNNSNCTGNRCTGRNRTSDRSRR